MSDGWSRKRLDWKKLERGKIAGTGCVDPAEELELDLCVLKSLLMSATLVQLQRAGIFFFVLILLLLSV
jgi:hypothetical protein